MCNDKIINSPEQPERATLPERGGYSVQPPPNPPSTNLEATKKKRAMGNNQNLILFIRAKAISGAINIRGTNQLPNPPIIIGITKKKIITKA